jgi:hypothetical protein
MSQVSAQKAGANLGLLVMIYSFIMIHPQGAGCADTAFMQAMSVRQVLVPR